MPQTDSELEALLDDLESDRVERKAAFTDPKKVRQAVCAFANDFPNHKRPGIIFIGANDRDGSPANLHVTDELLRTLSDMRTDGNILPLPSLTVECRTLKGGEMAVITVLPSHMPPVRYDGRIWIRIGPRRAVASADEERILNEKRRHRDMPFDIRPFYSSSLKDLSKLIFENEYLPSAFAPDILETNGRTYEERLSSCKMVESPDCPVPTVLGLLTLAQSPQDFFSGARILFLRINGGELADDVTDSAEITGTLSQMLRRAEEKLRAHNQIGVDVISGPTHRTIEHYPIAALLQALYNAVLHRNYENTNAPVTIYWFNDRIEIHNPGGPYGRVTCENFGSPGITDYRNPNIGDVLKTYGFVQAFGRGIAIIRDQLKRNGNPEPEFICTQSAVACIIRSI